MFSSKSDFEKYINGKRSAVIGVGISNKPLIRYICSLGAKVTALDMAEADDPYIIKSIDEFAAAGLELDWSLGKDYLKALHGFDIIFKTPKMRIDTPELISASKEGTIITSEMEVFFDCCPCRIIGITGSDGKTTTTTIIAGVLEKSEHNVHLGGNIGNPLIDRLGDIKPDDIAVVELSSFQLHSMQKSPDIALITNITPNHLDVHKDFTEYIDAKKNIFRYQNASGILVLNGSDIVSSEFASEAKGRVRVFAGKITRAGDDHKPFDAYYDEEYFYFRSGRSLKLNEIRLVGRHNLNNYCSAISVLKDLADDDSFISFMKEFAGVPHRNEFIRTVDGVDYYNSSIDSSPTRTISTLQGFIDRDQKVVIIAGGKDKNCDYTGLGDMMLDASGKIILCGQNSLLIKESVLDAAKARRTNDVFIKEVENYDEALTVAGSLANPGEAVVLTPAGTSFDKFRNFEERGDLFRKLVKEL
ncbi:MAG: UDP-N-acetylmuramoyl-L-alanine--D-glutamate ligase [Saccharofermentanales bacterium]